MSVQRIKLSLDVVMLAYSSLPAASLEAKIVWLDIKAQLDQSQHAFLQNAQPCLISSCLSCFNVQSVCAGGPLSVQTIKLSLDVLMLSPSTLPAASLEAEVVRPAINAQLDHFQQALSQDDQPLCDQRALHFQPQDWPHPLTVRYPLRGGGAGKVRQGTFPARERGGKEVTCLLSGQNLTWLLIPRLHEVGLVRCG